MRNKIVIAAVALIFVFGGTGRADVVQLDLLSLGMPATFNDSSPFWQTNFDLGVTFTEISHVYIDWSGAITGGLAVDRMGQQPHPMAVGVYASLGSNPYPRATDIYRGAATYPAPESFDLTSEIELIFNSTWSDLLDGQGTVGIEYAELIMSNGWYTEDGSVTLTNATLVVDGTVVPEPATLFLLAIGGLSLRRRG